MSKYDLSIIIPARNEEFLSNTVEDILKNIEGKTQVIVILDGEIADGKIPVDDRVKVITNPESIGQRASTNYGVKIVDSKYIMKCDAHCNFDKGFDVKMMADMQPRMTMVPRMYNLHVFDWECTKCGKRTYQGPILTVCGECKNKEFKKVIVWKEKRNPTTDYMRFDKDLRFQYWRDHKKVVDPSKDIDDLMCCIGACWMMEREFYWEIEGMDEGHGSWGQMGVELACKTWLIGGRQVINKKTWFGHLFRTQDGFMFPYPNPNADKAREYSKDLWLNNKWHKAIKPFSWIVDYFSPVPGW